MMVWLLLWIKDGAHQWIFIPFTGAIVKRVWGGFKGRLSICV